MFGMQGLPQSGGMGMQGAFNLFYVLVRGYSACVAIFLRRRFGGEALGLTGVTAVLLMIVYMAAHPDSRGMASLFCLWWIVLAFQRLGHFNRRRKGIILHSQYDGESLIAVVLPFLNVKDLPRLLDVVACLAGGWLLQGVDLALGRFIVGGGLALLVKGMIDNGVEGRQMQRMYDAEIEQRSRVERWRQRRF